MYWELVLLVCHPVTVNQVQLGPAHSEGTSLHNPEFILQHCDSLLPRAPQCRPKHTKQTQAQNEEWQQK